MSDSEESDTELANEIIKEQPVTKQKRQMSAEHLEKLRQGRIKSLEIRSKKGNEKKAVKLDKSLQETEKKLNELKIKKQPPKEDEEEEEDPPPIKVVKKKKKQPTVIFESDEDDDDNDRVIYVRRREKKVMPRPQPPPPPPLQPPPFIQPSPPPEPIKPKFIFKRPAYYNQYANY